MSFHEGELMMQTRAGVRDLADRVARIIGPEVPAAAAGFLAAQRFVFLATVDGEGEVAASVVGGAAGFAFAANPTTVVLLPEWGDLPAVRMNIAGSGVLGLLGIDFAARRRMRVNGRATIDGERIVVSTREVYSNCPQYITPRTAQAVPAGSSTARRSGTLDPEQQELIRHAKTFFIASAHPERGADISHRGGPAGFVEVEAACLTWPDYEGNNMFNTLGNLAVNPRTGLLFVDFTSGRTVQLRGRSRVLDDVSRAVRFDVLEVVDKAGAIPLRFDP